MRGDLQPHSEKETYAIILAIRSFRMLIALTARWDLEIRQLNTINAFPNNKLNKKIYIKFLDDYKLLNKIGRLLRALYSLR